MESGGDFWRKCSSCKRAIAFAARYWVCNVSTCNRARTGLAFCSVACWDAHVPVMRHRDSWAEERKAPKTREEAERLEAGASDQGGTEDTMSDNETLVVISKLKAYIRAKSEFNTSANAIDAISNKIRQLCDNAIENARRDGRKTVMDRDFQ